MRQDNINLNTMKKIMSILHDFLSAPSGQLSSKRLIGVFAWMVILGEYIYSGVTQKPMPQGYEIIIYAASALVGVDSITKAFDKKKNNEND